MAAGGGGSAKALDTRDVRHKKLTPDQQSYTYEDLGDGGTELFKAHSPELYQQLMVMLMRCCETPPHGNAHRSTIH